MATIRPDANAKSNSKYIRSLIGALSCLGTASSLPTATWSPMLWWANQRAAAESVENTRQLVSWGGGDTSVQVAFMSLILSLFSFIFISFSLILDS